MTADRARDGYLRVLVAYDGSERAEDALALALRLRAPSGGALTLASVRAHHRPWAGSERTAPADEPDAVADAVEAMLGEARHRVPPGVPVRVREILAASATRGLSELVEAVEADLAVVGSSSHAAPGSVAIERTAGRMLAGAPCAVAIPPAGARDAGPFRHIGVAFDNSPEAHAAVAAAYGLARRDGAAVTLVRALPVRRGPVRRRAGAARAAAGPAPRAGGARRRRRRGAGGVNPRAVLVRGTPQEAIAGTCHGVVDLLVTGSRGFGALRRAFAGSVSEALVEGAPHPVLVIPRPSAPAEPRGQARPRATAAGGDRPAAGAPASVCGRLRSAAAGAFRWRIRPAARRWIPSTNVSRSRPWAGSTATAASSPASS